MSSVTAFWGKRQARPVLHRAMDLIGGLRRRPFVRNVLVVMSGSVISQIITFALSPVISRLFTPADFGALGSFNAVTSVIGSIITLDYSQAVMLPEQREDAGQVFLLSCLATLTVTGVFTAVCLVFPHWVTGILKGHSDWILIYIGMAVLVAGLNGSFQAWCVRVKAFKSTAASQVVRGLCNSGFQTLFGVFRSGAPGLIVSTIAADLLASVTLLRAIRADLRVFLTEMRWDRVKRLAVHYSDFPAYSATQNLLNAISAALPVLLLTHYFGLTVAGAYSFGERLLSAPMGVILNALRQVLFQKAGEMHHNGRTLAPLFIKSTMALFGVGLVPAVILAIWSPQLFVWIFGQQWHTAGECARYLVLWLLFVFCNVPAVLFARLIRIQRMLFLYNASVLIARLTALVIGGLYLTALHSIALISFVGAVMNLALILFVGRAVLRREGQVSLAQVRDALAGS